MEFKIKKEDFPQLEMFLFSLNFPCNCEVRVSFIDSSEYYDYETKNLNGKLTLITI